MPHRVLFAVGGLLGLVFLGGLFDKLPVDVRAGDATPSRDGALGAGRPRARGRLVRPEQGVTVEGGELRVGETTVRVDGRTPTPRWSVSSSWQTSRTAW